MGKSFKKFEGRENLKDYKRFLRKEKRIALKNMTRELEKGNYDVEFDCLGELYNVGIDSDLKRKFLTPGMKRKYKNKINGNNRWLNSMTRVFGRIYIS